MPTDPLTTKQPGEVPSSTLSQASMQAVVDELGIRNVTAAWTDAVIRRDWTSFRTYWTDDAEFEIKEPWPAKTQGADNIVQLLQARIAPFAFFSQIMPSGVVVVKGDQASARWLVEEIGSGSDGVLFYHNYAFYSDTLQRDSNGIWQFSRRVYDYMFLSNDPFPGKAYPLPAQLG